MTRHRWSKSTKYIRLKCRSHEATLSSPMGSVADEEAVPDEGLQLEEGLRLAQRGIVEGLASLLRRVKEHPQLGSQPEAVGGSETVSQLCEHQEDDCQLVG